MGLWYVFEFKRTMPATIATAIPFFQMVFFSKDDVSFLTIIKVFPFN